MLCHPMDCSSPLGFSVHGILQARTLEWVAMPSSRGSFWLRDWIHISWVSWITGEFLTHWVTIQVILSYDSAIPLLHIYLKKPKIWEDICTPMFIAALFTTAKIWKQPKCSSAGEWIRNMWYVYTIKYYSAIKNNEFLPFATTWMDLEDIMLSEIIQTEKGKHYMWNIKTTN